MTTPPSPSWSIEVPLHDTPSDARSGHEAITLKCVGTDWDARLVDTARDLKSSLPPAYFTVLVRRVLRDADHEKRLVNTKHSGPQYGKGAVFQNRFPSSDVHGHSRPKPPMGEGEWPGREGQAIARSAKAAHDGETVADDGGETAAGGGASEGGRWNDTGPGGEAVGGLSRGNGVAVTACDSELDSPTAFGDLPTVRAMGTGDEALVIGFDTEFTHKRDSRGREVRVIDSYQFSCFDPSDASYRFEIAVLPLFEDRLCLEDGLYIVSLATGLYGRAKGGAIDPRGLRLGDICVRDGGGAMDFKGTQDVAFKRAIPIVLAYHYGQADLTAFRRPSGRGHSAKYQDVLHRVTAASGGLVGLQPVRFTRVSGKGSNSRRWLPFSVTMRDTMAQASPNHQSLEALGEVCGVPKLDVGDAIEDMTALRRGDLLRFLDYGVNDAVIVLEYLTMLWGHDAIPPVTISGAGARAMRAGVISYLGLGESGNSNREFLLRFRGLVKKTDPEAGDDCDDGLSYYAARHLEPVDGDANQTHTAWKNAFHGGWNGCLSPGYHPYDTYDHDIQSAYPTAMASIYDVDYVNGAIGEVLKDRQLTLADFPLGAVTPLVAYVSWEFPREVAAPCLPVVVGDSVIYPRTSRGAGAAQGDDVDVYAGFEGAWCCGPELYLALKLGAVVTVQIGYRMRLLEHQGGRSMSLRFALKQMVEDRAQAKKWFGKGSLEEQTIKVATNSVYGKLAQDVAERHAWNSWEEKMESIGGSSVTSPYHVSMTTSLVRALLLAVANEVPILSVTTDGFITREKDIESLECYGLAEVFRDAREFLSGDRAVWEIKHHQDDLSNFTTRGNVSLLDGGVLAKAGLKTPRDIPHGSRGEREWFRRVALSREGKISNPYQGFPTFQELSRSEKRLDFVPVDRCPEVSTVDFDLKREPVKNSLRVDVVDGFEFVGFETRPWDTIRDYQQARSKTKEMQSRRYGTVGDNRPSGCLRTRDDWETWFRRFHAPRGRRIRTAGSAKLTEIVAAHKEGIVTVDYLASRSVPLALKLDWLSSLGLGEFTRSQWDHMSKKPRRQKVLDGLDRDALNRLVSKLNISDEPVLMDEEG